MTTPSVNELENIKDRYNKRINENKGSIYTKFYKFTHFSRSERELYYTDIILKKFISETTNLKVLEVGAGEGDNLLFFKRLGLSWNNIFANELLEDRIKFLEENFPLVKIYNGDATEITSNEKYNIVFQSTVFSSILDKNLRQNLANKMIALTEPGGLILWYDFFVDNPNNSDVVGIKKSEIKSLFHGKKIKFKKVTLAPPIGRRMGWNYNLINFLFPFLRTHLIAIIEC